MSLIRTLPPSHRPDLSQSSPPAANTVPALARVRRYTENASMIAKFDAKNRVSVRNLRIREDTAKYLRNLNVNSAYYDPKTRTMRSNPYEGNGYGKFRIILEPFLTSSQLCATPHAPYGMIYLVPTPTCC